MNRVSLNYDTQTISFGLESTCFTMLSSCAWFLAVSQPFEPGIERVFSISPFSSQHSPRTVLTKTFSSSGSSCAHKKLRHISVQLDHGDIKALILKDLMPSSKASGFFGTHLAGQRLVSYSFVSPLQIGQHHRTLWTR